SLLVSSCNKDDGPAPVDPPEIRDEAEVMAEDNIEIMEFLETHFYEMIPNPANPNYEIIKFDTIAGSNSEKEPIMESEFLETKTVTQNDLEYTLYYLKIREGAEMEPKPTFADLAMATYRGQTMDLTIFDESVTPYKF